MKAIDGNQRRESILEDLSRENILLKGMQLSKKYGVSRQVIVQDIALLRAQGIPIISTAEGYMLQDLKGQSCKRVFCVSHSEEQIEDELNTIVDHGGKVRNVLVNHRVYGDITVDLMLNSRKDVRNFMKKLEDGRDFVPLMFLTKGDHHHVVEADTVEILDSVEEALLEKGYLLIL